LSLGGLLLASALLAAVLPLLPLLGLIDALHPRSTLLRGLGLVASLLLIELAGVALLGAAWALSLGDRARLRRWTERVQGWWVRSLVGALQRLFSVTITLEGELPALGGHLLLVRHLSSVDTLLPVFALCLPQKLRCRYVLKAELLWDPCLDIAGQRLPNAFVRRGAGRAAEEAAAIAALARDAGPEDLVVLFPEGTRYSPEARARAMAHAPTSALATQLRHSLPPRRAGWRALRRVRPDQPVALLAHRGLEQARSLRDIFSGQLLRQQLRLRCWSWPAEEVPTESEAGERWLEERWLEMDRWCGGD
jgi:1-acyl-sn-glycerol-3-phosphate acyltransferase